MICYGSQGIHTQISPRNSDLFLIECDSLDNLPYKSIITALENLKPSVPRKSYDILSLNPMEFISKYLMGLIMVEMGLIMAKMGLKMVKKPLNIYFNR